MSSLPRIGQWTTLDELQALQDKQLPHLLGWAARSPFYSKRIGSALTSMRTRADLESIEPTTKQDLRDQYPFGLLAVPKEELATYHESSGTAGQPTPSYYTAQDWVDLAERYARKWVGINANDVFLVRTPYALMITGHLAHAAARLHGATVVPGDNRSVAMPYSRVVRVLHDLGVTLSWSMPTETLMWAAAARAAGYEPGRDFPALRALFVGGEPVSPTRRKRISELWGVPVVEEYGSTETGSLAGECSWGHLHLWADRAIFEVYDPVTGTVGPEGSGQLVVTPLYREAMPLLRYNLGDDVEVSYADCPCGWALPTVRVLGRAGFGYPVGGATITQNRLEELVFSLPVEHEVLFWRARALPERLTVEVEVPDAYREAACAGLRQAIATEYGIDADVAGVTPGTLLPTEVLTGVHDVVKPRSLFGPDEDWTKGLIYY
ncbi:MAG TPA: AMP-binding protein [Actinophytocola sp.]|jgi:phenylacetate-CoA ligase|uniref:AMP-binding protein n=1 Tax=Actinophytocola sp. TaxID=1872138 RepID=UPI002F92067A